MMKAKFIQWFAILLILQTGLVHFLAAQPEFEETPIMGYLFMGNFLVALVAAYGIYRLKAWGWALGAALAAVSVGGYIWSRTLGLPGMEIEEWLNPLGVMSLVIEGLFLALLVLRPWTLASETTTGDPSRAFEKGYLIPLAVVMMVLFFSVLLMQGETAGSAMAAMNPLTVQDVKDVSMIPNADLERQYGIRLTQVTVSALNSIVDVRIKIIDPQKAHLLLTNHPVLFVDKKAIIIAPHMHTHAKLKPGQVYVMFFPTQNNVVHAGSQVSLVFSSPDKNSFFKSSTLVTQALTVK